MKIIIPLLLLASTFTASAKTNYSVKLAYIENPFSINGDYVSELNPGVIRAENVGENTKSLSLVLNYRPNKKIKLMGFKLIPKIKLSGDFYVDADFDKDSSRYKLLNRDKSDDQVRNADASFSVVAFRKLSRKSALFLDFGGKVNSSYNIEFDTFTSTGRIYDYGLISTSHQKYYFQLGAQAKLLKSIRLDSNYKVTLAEYDHDYSIFESISGQNNDNISHKLSLNTNFKFTKKVNVDVDLFTAYTEYQNKLAFKENGYIQSTGVVKAQTELDYSAKVQLNVKLNKSLRPYLNVSQFNKNDMVNGASDLNIYGIELGSSLKLDKKVSFSGSYSIKSFDFKSAIASLEDQSNTELLKRDVRTFKLGLNLYAFKFDFKNISNDSTREYDNINHNTFTVGYSSTF